MSGGLFLLCGLAIGAGSFAYLMATDGGLWRGWRKFAVSWLLCFVGVFTFIGSIPAVMGFFLLPLSLWRFVTRRAA